LDGCSGCGRDEDEKGEWSDDDVTTNSVIT